MSRGDMRLPCLLRLLLLIRWLHGDANNDQKQVVVKEVVLDSAVVDIVYLGKNHECVLVTTKSKRLYYSQDSGQSWNEITSKIETSGSAQIQVERIIVSPTDKAVAVLQTNRRSRASSDADDPSSSTSNGKWWPYVYVTEDSGQNWRRAWGKHHGLHSWIAHPTERSWALVSWWSGDCNTAKSTAKKDEEEEQEEDRKPCVHRLMFTKDLGRNFLQLAEYVVQFSWGSSTIDQTNRVYFTAYKTKSGDQGRLSLWTTEVDFLYVDIATSGRPKGSIVECLQHGNKFLVSGEFVLVAKVKDENQQTVHLMVSKDGGKSFQAALLPSGMGELEEKWYTVLDTSEGAVILHINSNTGLKDTGRIFVSDADGYKYSQSLVNNVRSTQGECEFDKVVSLQGVYLANIVVPDGPVDQSYRKAKEKAADDVEKEAAGGAEVDQKHGRGFNKGKAAKAAKEERTIRTVVSFDKGGAWRYLKAPKVNSLGKSYECDGKPIEECALHLHGTTSWDFYAPFYSSESSVGIIMGTGNVGPMLRFEPEETSTFLSRDGGLTWLEAHKGAYIYEFGDHGGLIVMADDLKKTTQVIFSWNEGESWFDFTVSSTPFEVDNIITEPNVTGTTFIMFGTREEGVGVIYYMKFDSLSFPACNGAWAADSVSSDYETWTPSDGVNTEKCLLGQQVTYTRRKRTSQCWNGEKFERPVVQKRCSCTQGDYSCDIGFVRGVNQMECVYGGTEMMPERLIPTSCSKTFTVSAYRKVAGDRCEGGYKPEPVEVPCPVSGLNSNHAKYAMLLVLVLGVMYLCHSQGSAGGVVGNQGFGEFSAKSRLSMQTTTLLQLPMDSFRWLSDKLLARGRGFKSYGGVTYRKVQGDEFDMDGMSMGNEESLTDFIDEAEHDDSAPRVYSSAIDDKNSIRRRVDERPHIIAGGVQVARHEVPRLQAPPTLHGKSSPEQFSISDPDQDDLL
mmetsp:Transcript_113889/g.317116  ORF Transcript_113889/g.317116 Transcript_113889/m.317116 type:complete len:956 (-) Transcript_113889:154-3021(-)